MNVSNEQKTKNQEAFRQFLGCMIIRTCKLNIKVLKVSTDIPAALVPEIHVADGY